MPKYRVVITTENGTVNRFSVMPKIACELELKLLKSLDEHFGKKGRTYEIVEVADEKLIRND